MAKLFYWYRKSSIALSLLVPAFVSAAPLTAPNKFTDIDNLRLAGLCKIVDVLYTFALIASIVFVMIAAFNYFTGGGDAEKIKNANKSILYAAVGVAIAILAKGFPVIVGTIIPGITSGDVNVCP